MTLPATWTAEQCEQLKHLWDFTTLSAREIAKKMGAGLSKNAIISKAHRMKLSARNEPVTGLKNSIIVPAPRGCVPCKCGVYALPGLRKCYSCSERGAHA